MKKVKHNFRDTVSIVTHTRSGKYLMPSEINKLYKIVDHQERRCI